MTDAVTIRLRVLGTVSLHRGGERLTEALSGSKRTALIVYLALAEGGGGAERDEILARFWPESTEARARAALRQLLHVLRKELGADVIQTEGSRIRLQPDSVVCDATEFRSLTERGRHEEALDLYRGELLPGFHVPGLMELEEWIDAERRELAELAARAGWTLVEEAEAAGDPAAAARWARSAVRLAPFHERFVRRLIELLDRSGDRAAALSAYDELAQRLERQWEVDPSPETQALIEGVKARREQIEAPDDGQASKLRSEPLAGAAAVPHTSDAPRPISVHRANQLRHTTNRRWRRSVFPIAGIVLAGIGWAALSGGDDGAPTPADSGADGRTRVVVLRFDHVGDDEEAYVANGLTEEVRLALSRSPGVLVKGLGYQLPERGGRPLGELGRLWDVDRILYGSVRTEGDRLRVSAYWVDARTEEHLWSEAFDGDPDDVIGLQDRVAAGIARGLGAEPVARARERTPSNSAAYQLWQQALWVHRIANSGPLEDRRDGTERAAALVREALELAPDFAPALANLGQAHLHLYGLGVREPELFRPEWVTFPDSARLYAGRALSLAPDLPEVAMAAGAVGFREPSRAFAQEVFAKWPDHPALLGNIRSSVLGWHRAVLDSALIAEGMRRELGWESMRGPSYEASSTVLTRLGMHNEAIRWRRFGAQLAQRGDDGNLAWQMVMAGRLDEASEIVEQWANSRTDEWPNRVRGDLAVFQRDYAAAVRFYGSALGQMEENLVSTGITSVDAAIRRGQDHGHTFGRFLNTAHAISLSRMGRPDEAQEFFDRAIELHLQGIEEDRDWVKVDRLYDLSLIYAELGDLPEAIGWFERAVDLGWSWYELAAIDPLADPLRNHPRFQELMAQVKADLDETAARARAWIGANVVLPD